MDYVVDSDLSRSAVSRMIIEGSAENAMWILADLASHLKVEHIGSCEEDPDSIADWFENLAIGIQNNETHSE